MCSMRMPGALLKGGLSDPNPNPNPDPDPNPNPNPNEPQGALLKGVIDETGLLTGGEIFIQIAHARAGNGVGLPITY